MITIIKKILILISLCIPAFLSAETININVADQETLMGINGVGEKLSQAIIDYREEHGAFESLEELADVRGIGPSVLEKNIDKLSIMETEETTEKIDKADTTVEK